MHSQRPNVLCPVGRNLPRGLGSRDQKAQAALEAELDTSLRRR